MASTATFDFAPLLAPIAADRPSGDWLPDVHSAIEQARRADDDLPQGDWKRDTKSADWRGVVKIATEALATRTKDLKTGAFLVEALTKQHGLAGVRDGLRLLRELQEQFWESLHPQIEEDGDLEGRIAPFEWLNSKLPTSIKEIGVTRSREGTVYSLLQWEESRALENLGRQNPDALQEAIGEGKIGVEQVDKAVTLTPRAFYEGLTADLDGAWEELQTLDRVNDEKFGRDAPGLVEVKKALEECRDVVGPIVKRKRELEPDAVPAADNAAAQAEDGAGSAASGPLGPIEPVNRGDALRRLNAVAAFFRRTEPHSPVAYLVERAANWGQMPLEQWLREVIHDETALGHVRETLGLTGPADGPGPG